MTGSAATTDGAAGESFAQRLQREARERKKLFYSAPTKPVDPSAAQPAPAIIIPEIPQPYGTPVPIETKAIAELNRLDLTWGGRPTVVLIIRLCAEAYGLTPTDLLSVRRTADVVRPRQIAMYLSKILTLKSLPEIGRRIGDKDHTTVLHAVRKMERLVETSADVAAEVAAIREQIRIVVERRTAAPADAPADFVTSADNSEPREGEDHGAKCQTDERLRQDETQKHRSALRDDCR